MQQGMHIVAGATIAISVARMAHYVPALDPLLVRKLVLLQQSNQACRRGHQGPLLSLPNQGLNCLTNLRRQRHGAVDWLLLLQPTQNCVKTCLCHLTCSFPTDATGRRYTPTVSRYQKMALARKPVFASLEARSFKSRRLAPNLFLYSTITPSRSVVLMPSFQRNIWASKKRFDPISGLGVGGPSTGCIL